MAISARVTIDQMDAVNAALEAAGFGPRNFGVEVYTTSAGPTHATLHAWEPLGFADAVKGITGVSWSETTGNPKDRVNDVLTAIQGQWAGNALPLEGLVNPGLHVDDDGAYWLVIQQYDTAIWPDPTAVPALVRRAMVPGEIAPWVQPLDQFGAYKLVNPFTGEPDRVTHNGQTWEVTQADGAGNNVFEPGVFGWTQV